MRGSSLPAVTHPMSYWRSSNFRAATAGPAAPINALAAASLIAMSAGITASWRHLFAEIALEQIQCNERWHTDAEHLHREQVVRGHPVRGLGPVTTPAERLEPPTGVGRERAGRGSPEVVAKVLHGAVGLDQLLQLLQKQR